MNRERDGVSNVLFVCTAGKNRSRTLAEVIAKSGRVNTEYAGVDKHALRPLTAEMLEWCDIVYCAEVKHREKIRKNKTFRGLITDNKLLLVLILDNYDYNDPELIKLIHQYFPYWSSTPTNPLAI